MPNFPMNILDAYQAEAMKTALYRERRLEIVYPVLGLVEETQELLLAQPYDELAECGDIMWYCSALCNDLGIGLSQAYNIGHPAYANMEKSHMLHRAAFIAGRTKKLLRGDPGASDKKAEIVQAVGDLVHMVEWVAWDHGKILKDVCDGNIAKVQDREERGVRLGDGDHR